MSPIRSRLLVCQFMLAASGCDSSVTLPAARSAKFQPIAFFEGRTHGDGELHKLFSKPVRVSVDSVGRLKNGTLILDQRIRETGKPASVRRWTITPVGNGRYSGTLTDAVGKVDATVVGARGYIHYTMKHGFTVDQQLAQQSDGTIVLNRLVVHKFGVRVATLSETIRKGGLSDPRL
ncbi:MAG: DUF3833 family protein [Sphingomicrobium sp.]